MVTVENWINKHGNKDDITTDLSDESPPETFSGFMSLDGTFKSVKLKKNDQNMEP